MIRISNCEDRDAPANLDRTITISGNAESVALAQYLINMRYVFLQKAFWFVLSWVDFSYCQCWCDPVIYLQYCFVKNILYFMLLWIYCLFREAFKKKFKKITLSLSTVSLVWPKFPDWFNSTLRIRNNVCMYNVLFRWADWHS